MSTGYFATWPFSGRTGRDLAGGAITTNVRVVSQCRTRRLRLIKERRMESHQRAASLVDDAGDPFIHPRALVEAPHVGHRTRVWAFAHILAGATIGDDCNICDGVYIENDVVVGNRVTVKCGVQLWDGVTLEDEVFVGPNATFTNDHFPRSRQPFQLE